MEGETSVFSIRKCGGLLIFSGDGRAGKLPNGGYYYAARRVFLVIKNGGVAT
jgi:hypothetical protein